ncbi:hypothetical protein [Rhizobium wuzhouense]|uniref:hypothetical protein n=1 Tax=Rhizobium wuzhouense TaxID=1986026 RepID=UPI0014038301|nr:hypothetical protein [Rhizobium wuzhouense]
MKRFNVHFTRADGLPDIRSIPAETPVEARSRLLEIHPKALITKIKVSRTSDGKEGDA